MAIADEIAAVLRWLRWPLLLAACAAAAFALAPAGWGWLLLSLAAAAFLIVSPGLRTAVWHARVPTAFSLLGLVALTVPEQVRFLLAGIDSIGQVLALAFAVFATGTGCWFWARWSLNLAVAGGVLDRARPEPAWTSLPRALAVLPAIAALVALWQSRRLLPFVVSIPLALSLLLAGAALVALAWDRRRRIEIRHFRVLPEGVGDPFATLFLHDRHVNRAVRAPQGWRAWLRIALASLPFHPALVVLLAAVLAVAAALTMGGTGPVIATSQALGAAPTALLGMAALLTLLAPVVGLAAAAWRWPALVLLALWIVGAAGANVNTMVRTAAPYPERPTLREAARRWLEHCAVREGDDVRVVLVAAAGGASRAALWAAAVLRALELDPKGPRIDPARHLFAVSGVSGGALGLSAYVATLDAAGAGCGSDTPGLAAEARHRALAEGLGRDFLSPALAGLFLGDSIWHAFGPLSAAVTLTGWRPVERTNWLEGTWEAAFSDGGRGGPMAAPLAAHTFPDRGGAPRLPLLFTSGTHMETGRLVVTAPVAEPVDPAALTDGGRPAGRNIGGSSVPGAIDAMRALDGDTSFAVAASNSARFPYVTAPGLLQERGGGFDHGQVVDGGYFDNLGTVAITAAAEALQAAHAALATDDTSRLQGSRLHVFLVQAWSDPDRVQRADDPHGRPIPLVGRCGAHAPAAPVIAAPAPWDILLSPFGALVAVRGERANGGALPLLAGWCGAVQPGDRAARRHYFAFTLGPDAQGVSAPLNWVLPELVRRPMQAEGLSGFPDMGNGRELDEFTRLWGCVPTPGDARCRAERPGG